MLAIHDNVKPLAVQGMMLRESEVNSHNGHTHIQKEREVGGLALLVE